MLALSSEFLGIQLIGVDEKIRRLFDLYAPAIALDHPLCNSELKQWSAALNSADQQLVYLAADSLRALPPEDSIALAPPLVSALPPLAQLCSLDANENQAASARIQDGLNWADQLGTSNLLINIGDIPKLKFSLKDWKDRYVQGRWRQSGRFFDRGVELEVSNFLRDRAAAQNRHLDIVKRHLDPLLERAESLQLNVAILNGHRPQALAGLAEMDQLLMEFSGSTLCSWFDVANADFRQQLGTEDYDLLKSTLKSSVVGLTVTDVIGLEAGLPPGEGELLLPVLLEGLIDGQQQPPPEPLVMRCRPGTEDAQILAGLAYLRDLGLDGPPPVEAEPFPIIGGQG